MGPVFIPPSPPPLICPGLSGQNFFFFCGFPKYMHKSMSQIQKNIKSQNTKIDFVYLFINHCRMPTLQRRRVFRPQWSGHKKNIYLFCVSSREQNKRVKFTSIFFIWCHPLFLAEPNFHVHKHIQWKTVVNYKTVLYGQKLKGSRNLTINALVV